MTSKTEMHENSLSESKAISQNTPSKVGDVKLHMYVCTYINTHSRKKPSGNHTYT